MRNSIAERIADFLKDFPPFNKLSYDGLIRIATDIRVVNLEKNQTLFQINDLLHDSFYVVASGVVNLLIIADAEETLLNKCIPGDIFGLRPFFAKNNYMMTAKAREESIVYAVPIASFRPFVAQNSEVLNFLLESFAANSRNPADKETHGKLISDNVVYHEQQSEIQFFQSLNYNKSPLKVSTASLTKDVAQLMTDNLADCAIISRDNFPVGIVTDSDLRSKIATGRFPVMIAVDRVMSAPVVTVPENVSLAEAQLLLLKNNVTHLCVTLDGSDKSEIRGVISQHDLIVAQASNPGVLIKEIKRSHSSKDLRLVRDRLSDLVRTSMAKNIPLAHINNIASEINMALIKRCIELSILDMGSPPARFAWLAIGSQGRKEQLLLTDQDSMLVFEDVAAEKYRDVKDYFLRLAKRTTAMLEKIGYTACPNGHMASNMLWCKSLGEWVKQYENWINAPGEKSNDISGIFFDFEFVFGEPQMEETLLDTVYKNQKKNSFFDYLGNDALRKPAPLTFFKKFNVEEEGENRDKLDIKTRALMPLCDGARLMALAQNLRGITNTYLRFKQLAMLEPKNSEIYLNCAEAYQTLSKYRTLEGLKYDSNGQFINLGELSKIDKEKIKNALEPIKDLEEVIKNKFRLTQFS
jgi:CBS domain-containing protein